MNITSENQKVLSTAALILSVIILLGALGLALWPLPSTASQLAKIKQDSAQAIAAGKKAKTSLEAQHKVALTQTWSGTGNEIGPTAYANLNTIASGLSVKIEGFRAQRVTDAGDVSQLPYVLNATGSFLNVLRFVNKIETTPTKLAVELFTIGAADESTDQVTATIGLEAYVLNNPIPATPTSSTTAKSISTKTSSKPATSAPKSASTSGQAQIPAAKPTVKITKTIDKKATSK